MATERSSAMVLFGVGGGLATACVVGGLVGVLVATKTRTEGRKGWNLVPVVVAAVDVAAGSYDTCAVRASEPLSTMAS